MAEDVPPDREAVMAAYRPIREAIQRVLRAAGDALAPNDITRAVGQVVPWADRGLLAEGGDEALAMIADVAVMEPNQRGKRAFDRFLANKGAALDAEDRALAGRMARGWFSIFRVAGKHEVAGLWLEDALDGDRRVWIVDELLEDSVTEGDLIGMRLFDAGPFHAGFGAVAQPDEETLDHCLSVREAGGTRFFRHSLAATLYGDTLLGSLVPVEEENVEAVIGNLGEQIARLAGKGRKA